MFNTIEEVLEDLRQGKMVVVMDDEGRENEGDLLCAAQFITPEKISESFEKRAKLKAEAEAFGANIDKRLRGEIVDMGGPPEQ